MAHGLHAKAIKDGTFAYLSVANHLLDSLVQCKNFRYAGKMFDEMLVRDVRSWTIFISGFSRTGCFRMVSELFRSMQIEGVVPNEFTLSTVLRSCSSAGELRLGKGIHGWIVTNGVDLDAPLANALLDVYSKGSEFHYAERLFEMGGERDSDSWNIMIDRHLRNGDVNKSVALFHSLPCRDVASWNTMISGLMRNGHSRAALELLNEMARIGPSLNAITLSTGLVLASRLSHVELGKQIHCRVLMLGLLNDGIIWTSLIDYYAKCRKLDTALLVIRQKPMEYSETSSSRLMAETVAWSSMIHGYSRNDDYEGALRVFVYMIRENIKVNDVTITTVFSACSKVGTLVLGRQIHGFAHKINHKLDASLASSLVDMYAKCGSLEDAHKIFENSLNSNVVLWSAMILACGLHGKGLEAIRLFEQMIRIGIRPNEISFIVVLTACSHSGMIEHGRTCFQLMQETYGIKPEVEHLTCMVDLFGRAGRLAEAKHFIERHGISHVSVVMKSFLSSCRIHGNIQLAKWASRNLGPHHDESSLVLIGNMYATNRRWEESARVRRGTNKVGGQSWIELGDKVHNFVSGDKSCPEIHSCLEKLIGKLREIGYSPSSAVGSVVQDVDEEEGEAILGFHSEKLAITCGIMRSRPGIPIRVMKNLRICEDCHSFTKLSSKLLGREFIVRDVRRFHHFKNGSCSCRDYW